MHTFPTRLNTLLSSLKIFLFFSLSFNNYLALDIFLFCLLSFHLLLRLLLPLLVAFKALLVMYVSVFWLCFPFLLSLIVVVLRVDIWISVLVLVKVKTIACLTVRGKIGWVWYVCGWMCLFRQQRRGRKSETPLETVRDWVVLFVVAQTLECCTEQ